MDIALEVALFVMAILLVKNLQMELKRKIFVVTAFGLRLALVFVVLAFTEPPTNFLFQYHCCNRSATALLGSRSNLSQSHPRWGILRHMDDC